MTIITDYDIENSRPLDVWKWSDFPEINTFVKEVYSKYFTDLYTLKDAQQRAKKHLKVMLIDLYVAQADDPKMTVGVPMSPQAYSKGSRWRSIHIRSLIIDIIKHAETVGLVEVWKGNESQGRVSRIRSSKALRKLFKRARLENHYWQLQESCRPPIVFRETKEKYNYTPQELSHLTEQDLQVLSRSVNTIDKFNAAIDNSYIDIPDLNSNKLKISKSGNKTSFVLITQSQKHIYRVFNDLSIDSGGRFYGPFWQQMPKKDRDRIHIDDELTVEIDFSGMHINLLYALLGTEVRYKGKDPYSISLDQYNITKDDNRQMTKMLLLIALNADGERKAINAFRNWLINEQDIRQALPDLKDTTIRPIIEALQNKHEHIKDMFFSGVAKELMTLDSMILDEIIEECLRHNVTVLPVHDSIIVQRKYGQFAEQLMKDAYEKLMKTTIAVTTSPISQGLGAFMPNDYKKRTKRYQASYRRWKERKTTFHYQKS